MHVPDGFLNTKTAAATGILAAAGLGMALRQARRHLPPRRVPLLGLAAAFVFAAQMLNFPVAGGTSGHLIGGVLVAALLGPSVALIVISAVLIVQCLMFADGGITALGANILNMGIIGGVGGWGIYFVITRRIGGLFGSVLAAAFASWCSTVLAAIVCAGELAASRTVSWSVALPAMAGAHMLIGMGEGIITALVLVAIGRTRPELLAPDVAVEQRSYVTLLVYGGLIALGLALFASPWVSELPDGLEQTLGIKATTDHPGLPISITGAVGVVVAFLLAWLLARVLVPKE